MAVAYQVFHFVGLNEQRF